MKLKKTCSNRPSLAEIARHIDEQNEAQLFKILTMLRAGDVDEAMGYLLNMIDQYNTRGIK